MQIGLGPWMLKAMVHDGKNMLDGRIEFDSDRHLGDVDLILTDRRSELVFRVSDDRGLTTREYVALVFSSEKSRWDEPSPYLWIYAPPVPIAAAAGPRALRVPTMAPPSPRDVMSLTP